MKRLGVVRVEYLDDRGVVIEDNPALVLDGSAAITIKCKEFQFGQEDTITVDFM
jgi:hypothetical protein